MSRKETDKQINLTFCEEDYEKLKTYCEQKRIPIATFLKEASKQVALQDLKNIIPDQQDNIATFRANIDKIIDAYIQALDSSANAYDIASSNVKKQLDALQDLISQNKELSKKVEDLTIKVAEKETQLESLIIEKKSFDASNKELEDLRHKNSLLNQSLAEIQKKHNDEIKKMQDEQFEKIIKLFQANNNL